MARVGRLLLPAGLLLLAAFHTMGQARMSFKFPSRPLPGPKVLLRKANPSLDLHSMKKLGGKYAAQLYYLKLKFDACRVGGVIGIQSRCTQTGHSRCVFRTQRLSRIALAHANDYAPFVPSVFGALPKPQPMPIAAALAGAAAPMLAAQPAMAYEYLMPPSIYFIIPFTVLFLGFFVIPNFIFPGPKDQ